VRVVSQPLPLVGLDQPVQQWLMSGVQGMLFSYFDGSQWRQEWDSTAADPATGATNSLPLAIKVQIQLVSQNTGSAPAYAAPIELIVPITVQPAGNQSQPASGGSP
jgi:hypothetical protein